MNAVETAIYNLLHTNALIMATATAVYYNIGPEEAEYPFIVFFKQPRGDADRYVLSGRAGRVQSYVVKAVDLGLSKQRAQSMADAVDAALTDAALTLGLGQPLGVARTWYWRSCRRFGDIEYAETLPDGQNCWHVGGSYGILVST